MRLAGRFAPGMPVWVCVGPGRYSPGIIESVGRIKLTVVVLDGGERIIQSVGPTFLAPRDPKRYGADRSAAERSANA